MSASDKRDGCTLRMYAPDNLELASILPNTLVESGTPFLKRTKGAITMSLSVEKTGHDTC